MCWRQVSRVQKNFCAVLLYFFAYLMLSYLLSPKVGYTFVREDLRVGERHALVFVAADTTFSDVEGADVFETRGCGGCFLTSAMGFLPLDEYDAVLLLGNRTQVEEDHEKSYILETGRKCLARKFRRCLREPKLTSFDGENVFNLCGLCRHLLAKRSHLEIT